MIKFRKINQQIDFSEDTFMGSVTSSASSRCTYCIRPQKLSHNQITFLSYLTSPTQETSAMSLAGRNINCIIQRRQNQRRDPSDTDKILVQKALACIR